MEKKCMSLKVSWVENTQGTCVAIVAYALKVQKRMSLVVPEVP